MPILDIWQRLTNQNKNNNRNFASKRFRHPKKTLSGFYIRRFCSRICPRSWPNPFIINVFIFLVVKFIKKITRPWWGQIFTLVSILDNNYSINQFRKIVKLEWQCYKIFSLKVFSKGLRICGTQPESMHDVLDRVVISFDHSSHARKTFPLFFDNSDADTIFWIKLITGKAACILKISLKRTWLFNTRKFIRF